MLSFHNDPAIKEKYCARVAAHIKADELIHGKYWEGGKGCAVGCTIHGSSHKAYEDELGIPEWLAGLQDTLFEGMVNGDSKKFVADFLPAIPIGVNLDRVKYQFCAYLMRENIERVESLKIADDLKQKVLAAIRGVLSLHEEAAETGEWNESAAESAWFAAEYAESAARSAWSAARSAESAARSAWSAARSAESAARFAWSAAESAAWSAAYKKHGDELLRLLREAK